MTRRKLVALVSAAVLLTIVILVLGTGLVVTHTDYGRGKIRNFAVPLLQSQFPNAKIYVGKVEGSLIGGVTIDTIAIRDSRGELFASTGRVTLEWNWRDLIDNRLFIQRAHVEHPFVHIIQHKNGVWNFREIFATKKSNTPQAPKSETSRGWGSYIVIDSATASNTTFLLTMPWNPDDSLPRAVRDSIIKVHLTDPEKAVARTYDGFGRTYAWRNGHGMISHIRLADPDSDKFGRLFRVASLSVDEYVPTFKFRNLRGDVQLIGDTVNLSIPHFELPRSFAKGQGRVWWGSDLPVRYDIAIHSDSLALDDVNWVYPTLPKTGGGSLDLQIKNDQRPGKLNVVDFRILNANVRTTGSHLMGNIWFGIGDPILYVRNVDMKADPVTFDFIRALNGRPFPFDWRGDIFGYAKGPGGPLTHFVVSDARGRFEDAHVRGAVSRFSGHGELDILQPAYTAFHHFDVDAQTIDLRTIEFLNPAFPRLGGVVSGTATLDSSWLDVRFSNAHLAHQDGPGEPSRVSGSGRVTYGTLLNYDMTLNAEPLNFTMLARSKPLESLAPIHGLFSGPLRLQGTAPDLQIATTLESSGGAFSFEGRADIDSIGGYGAHGRGQFSNLALGTLLDKKGLPEGLLSGHYEVALDSILVTPSSVRGSAQVALDRTIIDSLRVLPSVAFVRFADGKMLVDTLRIHTDAFTADASGGVGLPQGTPDSLQFHVYVDSLGGWRPLLPPPVKAPGALTAAPDSLAGSGRVSGVARGTLDALSLDGELFGSRLYINKEQADSVYARFDLRNALTPGGRTGTIVARVDSVTMGGVALDTIGGTLTLTDSTHRNFVVGAVSRNGPRLVGGGRWTDANAIQTFDVDSLGLAITDDSRWTLASPARITIDSTTVRVDSALLRNRDSAFVAITARVPSFGAAYARLQAAAVPLRDVGVLAQLSDTLYGTGALDVTTTGTKLHPVIEANSTLSNVKFSGMDIDQVLANATYRDFRLNANAEAVRRGTAAITANASWPFDVTLFSAKQRDDSVRVAVRTDTTDLSLLAPLFPKNSIDPDSLKGRIFGYFGITGKTSAKKYDTQVSISDGRVKVKAAGVTFIGITGGLTGGMNALGQDSIDVNIAASTNTRDHAYLGGWIANVAGANNQPTRFGLKLFTDSLHAFNRRTVADVYLSTTDTLRLTGPLTPGPTLTGALRVDGKSRIFLTDPDLARKLAVETLDNDTRTKQTSTASLFTNLLANLRITSVPVTLGEDVRLSSPEADVRLNGTLELVKGSVATRIVTSTGQLVPGLTLTGQLLTTSGTYNLNLGIVQREFTVLPGGTVIFDGSSPETPLVDIRARYNVKQFKDRDLGVIVNLKGRIPNPTLTFTSDADYEIATSDLLSYLITGTPGFDFGADPNTRQVLAQLLSPTISAYAADRLRRSLGSFVDAFQFELGTYNVGSQGSSAFSSSNVRSYLSTATIDAEKQVYRDVYLGVNAGLCGIRDIGNGSLAGLGVKIEYRFQPNLSFQAAYDPPQLSRTSCIADAGTQNLLGLVPSPSQFSFAVRHTWRF